ncbi:uncharacterized protein VTP21DRAFT_10182 [Calcarisporiella thermophila]|uniref:uncharacterized protein n=1 Tax=Calcarisporiella thermophila TaxID=911321 RepID=UPI0037428E44
MDSQAPSTPSSPSPPPKTKKPSTDPLVCEDAVLDRLSAHMSELESQMKTLESTIGSISSPDPSCSKSLPPPSSSKRQRIEARPPFGNPQPFKFSLKLHTASDLYRLANNHSDDPTGATRLFLVQNRTRSLPSLSNAHDRTETKGLTRLPSSNGPAQHLRHPFYLKPFFNQCISESEPDEKVLADARVLLQDTSMSRRHIIDGLFHIYASPCFILYQCVDRADLLERFYRDELDFAFVYAAVAWAAQHSYLCHTHQPDQDLRAIAKASFEKARAHLEDVFDEPSELTVLASLTISDFLLAKPNYNSAYTYLGHAVSMARQLGLEKDDPGEKNLLRREARRRLCWALHMVDVSLAVFGGMPPMMAFQIRHHVARPVALPSESEDSRRCLAYVAQTAEIVLDMYTLPRIDPDVSEGRLLEMVALTVSVFKRHLLSMEGLDGQDPRNLTWNELACLQTLWCFWAQFWFSLLSEGGTDKEPPERQTPAQDKKRPMGVSQQLRSLGLQEVAKAACKISQYFNEIARRNSWCHFRFFTPTTLACHLHLFITRHHPDAAVRHRAMGHLVLTLNLLKKCTATRWPPVAGLLQWLQQTFDRLTQGVISLEELVVISGTQLRLEDIVGRRLAEQKQAAAIDRSAHGGIGAASENGTDAATLGVEYMRQAGKAPSSIAKPSGPDALVGSGSWIGPGNAAPPGSEAGAAPAAPIGPIPDPHSVTPSIGRGHLESQFNP